MKKDLLSCSLVLSDRKGMALILTLLVITIITAMVVEFAYGVYINTSVLHNWQTAQRLSAAAKSSIYFGARLLSEKSLMDSYTYPGYIDISQKIPFKEIDGIVYLGIEDENSKFNLNSLVGQNGLINRDAYAALLRMLTALEIKNEIAGRIIDWIDPDSEPNSHDSENSAKNGYLDSVDELLLIPGIDKETYDRLRPYITVYGSAHGTFRININGAEAPVLMLLSDSVTREMAERIIRYREATPFEEVNDIFKVAGFNIGTLPSAYLTVKGRAFYLRSSAQSANIKRVIESVIEISGSSRIIRYWKEY
jgi:general secretion pathway protein K